MIVLESIPVSELLGHILKHLLDSVLCRAMVFDFVDMVQLLRFSLTSNSEGSEMQLCGRMSAHCVMGRQVDPS